MKEIVSIFCIIIFLLAGCKKETEEIESTIEGNWKTVYELSKRISTKTPGKVIYEYVHPQNEILIVGLEIAANSMKFIYGEDDYAKVKYKLQIDSATNVSYIYIINSNEKIQYSLKKDTLTLFGFSSGSRRPNEEPHYSLTETKLLRQK